ncbi:MAG: metal ABC transporter permease [Chloroflexota bacterium]|nr:metal ABC transporter permease [Chloroflexota bacterium]
MLETLHYAFMQRALFAALLASVACGIIGCYVIVKRMVFISGGVAHASFGGVGLGIFTGINPVLGALLFTPVAAVLMGWVTKKTRLPEDTAIGILWSIGMALGIIFINLSTGYVGNPFSFLIGNILLVSSFDINLMIALDVVIVLATILFYKEFLALSFDEEFSMVIGVPTGVLYLVLLCLIALTVVILIRVVGIILVIALLTFPAAMARRFTYNLKTMMVLAIIFSAVFTLGGLWLSAEFGVASGATIILFGGVVFLVTLGFSGLRGARKVAG